jgi:acyl-CoA thioester hydrolase
LDSHIFKIRVIYADTDAMGIVYHTNYIKWFEIGRNEMLRAIGLVYSKMESEHFNMPLSEAYCHYLYPAKFDDILNIETSIAYVRRASMRFNYTIWDEKNEKVHAEGYTIHACTTNKGKIVRFPADFSTTIKKYYNIKQE